MPNTGSSYEVAIPLAGWARAVQRSALQEMLSLASGPGILSLALGLPAAEFFPVEAYAEAVAHVLSADPRALQYGPPSERLKAQIVELMATRGVECHPAQVFITSGAQQGLSLLTRLLLEPGGTVLTEEMIYPGFRQVIEPFQPRLLTVPTDLGTGMDVEAVERLLRGGERPALIYTVADGHNPLAVSMSAEKRARLAELARRYGVPVIEDDPYGFIYYGERPTTPVKAADEQWVYYAGSFSKILAPALRVGWLVVPEALTGRLSIVKESSDIDTATLSQRAVSHFLDSCDLDGRLAGLRREYGLRRDAMLRALAEHFPDGARWQEPSGGFFVWVELPAGVEAGELLRAAVSTERIAFIPGQAFWVGRQPPPTNCMRLNFSHNRPEVIEEAVARLARVLKSL